MNVAVIGFGYWGPNLVRNFNNVPGCRVSHVCDFKAERLAAVQKAYPGMQITQSYDEILQNNTVDAVIIATPVFAHFTLAKQALLAGKHVLIEKPMTASSAEALELINLAAQKKLSLMVDHTFLYNGAIQKMKQLVDAGELGNINYFDSTRINLGLFQPDVNVLWDLAPHDISIMLHLVKDKPFSVNATGVSHTRNDIENIAYMTVNFQNGMIAHFNCSWTSPVKIRLTLLGGDKKMVVYNDMEPTEKVKIYDTGYSFKTEEEKQRILVDYRAGDIFIPKLNTSEALLAMARDFYRSVHEGTTPVSDAQLGLDVVSILEASQQSIKKQGAEIKL